MVVLRDLINGKKRFTEFLDSPERISTNVLTDRLVLLERSGLVTKFAYQERPKRFEYALTSKGQDLHPILQEMCRWANRHIQGTWVPPERFMRRWRRTHTY